jgi:hypothetical protein
VPYIFKFDSSLLLQMGISKLLVYEHVPVCLAKYLKREWTLIDLIDIRKKK